MYTLKKSLGQHFLIDEGISQKIVELLQELPVNQLLEVGPGGGALTKYLVQIPNIHFKCVELDQEKVDWLIKHFPVLKDKIINKDILKIPPPFEGSFAIVGNFPYNISTQIVFKVLEWKEQVHQMVGMFQKEVADRIVSKEGSKVYGVTSVLVQAFYEVETLLFVPETAFNPPPKVQSSVIRLVRKPAVEMRSEKHFFSLVKMAFNQRRKTLRNAVKAAFEEEILKDPVFQKRAEQLSVEDFAALTYKMK